MDCGASSEVFFLPDEKFDFDVSLSPASSRGDEDEDEVFVGPISDKEKCISVNGGSPFEDRGSGVQVSWSPLTGEQLEAVRQEAHRLASQLQSNVFQDEDTHTTSVITNPTTEGEEFAQDTKSKLGILAQTSTALSPIKRQTFCVQDSPMKHLPPAIQHHLQRGSSSSASSSTRSKATASSSTLPTSTVRLSTSSPVAGAKAQSRTTLRGKAALGVAVVLPSKPAVPATSCSASKSRVEKTKLQPPRKVVGSWRRSPSSCPSDRAESYEDLLSDSMSVASDISDSSLNSSLLGKRTLAPPTKKVGVRNMPGVKAPPLQSRRKNTSSSSSSVSSFNSSISLSPAKGMAAGKLNSSVNRSLSSSTGPAPRSGNSLTRPRRSTVYSAVESVPSAAAGRRSLSTQAKKLAEAERAKAARSTAQIRAEATPPKRAASIPTSTSSSRLQSGLKAKPKPEAAVLPTPTTGGKGVHHANDVSKVLKPKRLVSVNGMDSLPQKPSAGPLTPSAGNCKSLQLKARRPSALPTPVRRKASLLPSPTPKPPAICGSVPAPTPASYRKQSSCSPAPRDAQVDGEEEPADVPEIQPFCLEEEPPAVAPSDTPQADQSERTDPGALSQDESPSRNLIELESTEESNSKTQEVLLLDLPPPTLPLQEKLLIDLTNTPDLIRTNSKTSSAAQQLIDLSSPLIKWSPEDKTENTAPLINLSF